MPAHRILSAWTALEVLSPQSFRKDEDLAVAPADRIYRFLGEAILPWFDPDKQREAQEIEEAEKLEEKEHKKKPKKKDFYQLVLGTIDLKKTSDQLLECYADRRIEHPNTSGHAILAVVVLNNRGQVVKAPSVVVSSFGWGFVQALGKDLKTLANWPSVEKTITEDLSIRLGVPKDESDRPLPLDKARIESTYQWLIDRLELPPEFCRAPYFVLRSYQTEAPEPLVLNSFYLGDLARARTLFSNKEATHNLEHYLGLKKPRMRYSLLENIAVLEEAVSPTLIPPARWPGMGRHSLILLQQAAVNLALRELKTEGLLAINGPPGTGKTTLLRDMVAALVTARANALCYFENPASAFGDTGQSLEAGQGTLMFHRLDSRIKGFEMLVASSNNKAVENVSAELPNLSAIAEDCEELRYFKSLSDALVNEKESNDGEIKKKLLKKTWGLIAAVLGNSKNRHRFRETFWWDKDKGFASYLSAAMGYPPIIEIKDPITHKVEKRPALIVTEEKPPENPKEALERWKQARRDFITLFDQSNHAIAEMMDIRQAIQKISYVIEEEIEALKALQAKEVVEEECLEALKKARQSLCEAQNKLQKSKEAIKEHQKISPGFWAYFFRKKSVVIWDREYVDLFDKKKNACKILDHLKTLELKADSLSSAAHRSAQIYRVDYEHKKERSLKARKNLEIAYQKYGDHIIDGAFFDRPHTEKHQTVPWCDEVIQQKRDALFVSAMKLHRAFIDAAAKPLKHNLAILMNIFAGRLMTVPEKKALVADLWSSLFLVVPCLSTTFASVERMLRDLPPESLGWLLIDEAGQALPQAAIGAIMRTKRALLVGDPMQIKPVVVLPETLTQTICRCFEVDPTQYNAPEASAQTLADAATPFYATFQAKEGSRVVGVPLLVHRRCSEPMFSLSNAIAYEQLMVHAKKESHSPIRECLGPSAWIDVQSVGDDKWSPAEGKIVLDLLHRLREAAIHPNLYIVTPFVVVARNLRTLIQEDPGIRHYTARHSKKWCAEHIGTVHTVQGREAEAVIFVLGAPEPQQQGARGWAGTEPNLLNVALTRAKEVSYIIGNRQLWKQAGLFQELDARMPESV